MIRGLSKVIALSANIEADSVMELLFDKTNEELFGFKHKKAETKRYSLNTGIAGRSLSTVLLATIQGPVTSEWILNKLVQYNRSLTTTA